MSFILILIGCVFVNNVVLSQFMGICPFLGVSKQMKSSVGMGAAVIFVMICATAITYPVYRLLEHFVSKNSGVHTCYSNVRSAC